ncbi:MAG: NADH-quinone oxidoreductase subunit NuoF [Planctomycetota bacterium]|nr:MAG: NADH-quinone oxidoreductase subunit NuoF [Planctomycetota bacterium]
MTEPVKVLTEFVHEDESWTIDRYLRAGGYEAARKACTEMQPEEIIDFVKRSGLRGRGGAGFPTGLKWSFVPKDTDRPKFLALNGDESEPGTFKDRLVMERWPHSIIEGALIACRAVGISTVYLYIRGEMPLGYRRLVGAVKEAYDRGFLGKNIFGIDGFDVDMTIHRGAGAYICGEETGMLSSIEGGRGYPKLKPPFPAVSGLFGMPTVVNNVVTIAYLPYIFGRGIEWWRSFGTEKSPGLMPYSVSGHVERRGVYELPLGVTLRELFELAGGWSRPMKAVIPGGSSSKVLRLPDAWDVPMTFEGPMEAGSMLGSAAVVFMDETVCMVDALYNLLRFYEHESCGQCTPCREGTGWSVKIVRRIAQGKGRPGDIETLLGIADQAIGKTICVFAEAFGWPIQSYVALFRDEFEAYIRKGAHVAHGAQPQAAAHAG